jgi:hypothetical protein
MDSIEIFLYNILRFIKVIQDVRNVYFNLISISPEGLRYPLLPFLLTTLS